MRAEIFLRKMLRWAMKTAPVDTRVSFLYVATNSTNLQLLCQKNCVRFFNSLQENPRFCTEFVKNMSSYVDSELLGHSPLVWWPEVVSYYGQLHTVTPLYKKFKSVLISDLRLSIRIQTKGLTKLICKIVSLMYHATYFAQLSKL